ncbi:MAG: hypothetical protein RLY14_3503 [Planctomycetota bacterium]
MSGLLQTWLQRSRSRTLGVVHSAQKAEKRLGINSWQAVKDLHQAALRWNRDEAAGLAASVSYYLALSLFPMMLLLSSGIGLFLRFSSLGQDAQSQILNLLAEHTSPVVRVQIEQVLLQMGEQAVLSGPAGLLAATLAAIGVFCQFDRALNKIWNVTIHPAKGWKDSVMRIMTQRISAFIMLLGLGILLIVVFMANLCLSALHTFATDYLPRGERWIAIGEICITIGLNGLIFGMVYRVLAKRSVCWADAYRGGLLVAVIWEAGRNLLGLCLIGMRYTTAYGVIGSFIALLAWCFYGVSIILYGAEYIQILQERRAAKSQSDQEPALNTAESYHSSNAFYSQRDEPRFLKYPTEKQPNNLHPSSTPRIRPRRVA